MPIHWPAKSPGENDVDYDLDWTGRLNVGDAIASSAWMVLGSPASLTIADGGHAGNVTKVFLSGGTSGQTYTLQNVIATVGGEVYSRQTSVLVKAQ
jgi:hypothetical protein